jgi:hypothetical protein
LDEPASRFVDLATTYASELVTVDAGMLTLIRASAGVEDDEERVSLCELFASVRAFATISRDNYGSMQEFAKLMDATAGLSREVRPPIKKLKADLQRLMDGQAVIDEWERQIDASGLDCGAVPDPATT